MGYFEKKKFIKVNRNWFMLRINQENSENKMWITLMGGFYICQYANEVIQRQKFYTERWLVNHRIPRLKEKWHMALMNFHKPAQTESGENYTCSLYGAKMDQQNKLNKQTKWDSVGCTFSQTHLFLVVLKQSLHMVPWNNVRTHRMIPKSTDFLTNKLLCKVENI